MTCLKEKISSDSEDMTRLAELARFCSDCVEACEKSFIGSADKSDAVCLAAANAAEAVMSMVHRLQSIVNAKMVFVIAEKKGNVSQDVKSRLPKVLQSMAHILEIDWASEHKALEDPIHKSDPAFFHSKLEMFDAALAATDATLLKDDAFSTTSKTCKEYCNKYVQLCAAAVDQAYTTCVEPLKAFAEKYQEVEPCAKEVKFDSVKHLFKNQSEGELKADIDALRADRKSAMELVERLSPLAKRTDASHESPMLRGLGRHIEKQMKELQEFLTNAARICTTLIFSDLMHVPKCDDKELDRIEKHTQKHFGMGKSSMPPKLVDALNKLAASWAESAGKAQERGNKRTSDVTTKSDRSRRKRRRRRKIRSRRSEVQRRVETKPRNPERQSSHLGRGSMRCSKTRTPNSQR